MTSLIISFRSISSKIFILCNLFNFVITQSAYAQDTSDEECADYFSSEIIKIDREDDCVSVELNVYSNNSATALSHLVVGIPCGIADEISNSGNWQVENFIDDPTTGISGFKIDDISKFGEDGRPDTFSIAYTICSPDPACLSEIQSGLTIAYKTGNCEFIEEIPVNDQLDVQIAPKDVSCYNGTDGALYTTVTGGREPFSFQWNNGSNSADLQNVNAGLYTVIVTDAAGNTVERNAEVKQPEFPLGVDGVVTDASCSSSDGSVNVEIKGGQSPYTFSWSNGDTTQNLLNTGKGSYIIQVTDALGCSSYKSFTIAENTDLDISLAPNYLECYQEGEGEIMSEVTGGTAPYEYSWSNGATDENIAGVNSGLYNLTVTDAGGCTKTKSAYVGIRSLSVSASVTSPSCNGGNDGEIILSDIGYGTGPFSYLWSNGDSTSSLSGISGGRYSVSITDSMGCTATRSFTVSDPAKLNLTYSVVPRNCSEDSAVEIHLSGTGGSGIYEYFLGDSLVGSAVILPGNGDYEILMKDSKGCETLQNLHIESSGEISIIPSIVQPSCTGLKTGYASIAVNGGAGPYKFKWSDGIYGSSRSDLVPGEYSLNVIDANGCLTSASFNIDSINEVIAGIEVLQQPVCNSENNLVYASSVNATNFAWELNSNDSSWIITDQMMDQAFYHAGNDSATIIYRAWNEEGCGDADSLVLTCSSGDGGGIPGDPGTGDDPDIECSSMGWTTEITNVTPLDFNCYRIEMLVKINGYSEHDLSHLIIGLDDAFVSSASNSENFKTGMNVTDPKSGLRGLKIDDIHGFGNDGLKEFTITYEVCYGAGNDLPESIQVLYKAATCSYLSGVDVVEVSLNSSMQVSAFPNPFKDQMTLRLSSPEDTEVNIAVYDLRGNMVDQLYTGKIKAGVEYTFPFTIGENNYDNIFIYKIVSPSKVLRGQVIRQR